MATPDLPTFNELYDAWKSEAQTRQPSLTDFNEGSNLDALAGATAVLADEVVRIAVDLFSAHFVDTAEGQELDDLAADRFNLSRKAAQSAVGTLTYTRGSAVGSYSIPAGSRVSASVDGQTVVVETDVIVNMEAAESTVDVTATAQDTGQAGNVSAGSLTTIVDTITADTDATVTNAQRFAGGRVAETDEEFRGRIRLYFQTLRHATVAALEFGAKQVGGVEYATVDETNIAPEDGAFVRVVIGDPDGNANQALADLVSTELENWRAAGVQVIVSPAEIETIASMVVSVVVPSGLDQGQARADIITAIANYTNTLPPGAKWYKSLAQCAGADAVDEALDVTISTPSTDVAPAQPFNALRVDAADITVNFTEV